jgi:hypothetical protein
MLRKFAFLALITVSAVLGQGLPVVNEITFQSVPPPGITNLSAVYTGVGGSNCQYYWIVTNYVGGSILPSTPPNAVCNTAALGGGNSTFLSWTKLTGQTTADILKTSTNQLPTSGSCTCAVATGVTGNSITDTGASLSAYTLSGFKNGTVQATMTINVRDYATPVIQVAGFPILAVNGLAPTPGGAPIPATEVVDTNGNPVLIPGTAQTGAVNQVTVTNAASGSAPEISASGTDTNIGLEIATKGTGQLSFSAVSVVAPGTQGLGILFDTGRNTSVSGAGVTITAAEMVNSIFEHLSPSATQTDTTDSATDIIAAIPANACTGGSNSGTQFQFVYYSTAAISLAAGSGVTFGPSPLSSPVSVSTRNILTFTGQVTNCSSPAVTLTLTGLSTVP